MSNLTEKWKNRELVEGYYYTQYNSKIGKPFIEIELRNYLLDLAKVRDADTVKILAPVPSYETYLTMKDCAKMVFEAAERETKLKDLLKECKSSVLFEADVVKETSGKHSKDYKMLASILTKIDEALK